MILVGLVLGGCSGFQFTCCFFFFFKTVLLYSLCCFLAYPDSQDWLTLYYFCFFDSLVSPCHLPNHHWLIPFWRCKFCFISLNVTWPVLLKKIQVKNSYCQQLQISTDCQVQSTTCFIFCAVICKCTFLMHRHLVEAIMRKKYLFFRADLMWKEEKYNYCWHLWWERHR